MSELIFDEIRKKWIKATPEEKVRQKWLHHFVHSLGFPKELIAVEKDLKDLPQLVAKEVPDRRVDILCYGRRVDSSFFPLLLVECKEKGGTFAKEQVIGYNAFVQAPFVAIADRDQIHLGYLDGKAKNYLFLHGLPTYRELIEWQTQPFSNK